MLKFLAAALALLLATAAQAATLEVTTLTQDARRDLLIEGVAHHAGRTFVSSVAAKTIFEIKDGRLVPFLRPDPQTGGIFGLAIDTRRGELWAAEASGGLPNNPGPKRTALLRISLADGSILSRHPAPDAQQFGDVVVDRRGEIFASDGATGAIWALHPRAIALRKLAQPKGVTSAQGMMICRSGALVVSDYETGLHRIDTYAGESHPLAVTGLKIAGVDGLTVLSAGKDGFDVAATYNGAAPHRLLRLKISADCERLEATESVLTGGPLTDVALAALTPDGLAVVSNSQWSGWTAEGARNDTDPGPATVALVKLPAHP